MPAATFATILSLPCVASIYRAHQHRAARSVLCPKRRTHHDVHRALLVAVAPERVRVLLPVHGDALPAELLDRDERLVDVRVLRDEVRPEVEREPLRVQNVRRRLREV